MFVCLFAYLTNAHKEYNSSCHAGGDNLVLLQKIDNSIGRGDDKINKLGLSCAKLRASLNLSGFD